VPHRAIEAIDRCMPEISPEDLAPMEPITYESRDGVAIHAYLTVPLAAKAMHLPLVVVPHPRRDIRATWQFDPLVQFLASRGYAVLQVNYRGTPGFGEGYLEQQWKEQSRLATSDVEDAAVWAAKTGLADPRRIAVLGEQFGGFLAWRALLHANPLFRCGIVIDGVSDWSRLLAGRDLPYWRNNLPYWKKELGAAADEAVFLRSLSPVTHAAELSTPVLMVQRADDPLVQIDQTQGMVEALRGATYAPQTLFLPDETAAPRGMHYLHERMWIQAAEEFLEAQLAPGLIPHVEIGTPTVIPTPDPERR